MDFIGALSQVIEETESIVKETSNQRKRRAPESESPTEAMSDDEHLSAGAKVAKVCIKLKHFVSEMLKWDVLLFFNISSFCNLGVHRIVVDIILPLVEHHISYCS